MGKNLFCLRCDSLMKYISHEKLQLGKTGWILGDLPNLLAGAIEVAIYVCRSCGKIEFFQPEMSDESSDIAMRKCPNCGNKHEFDYPKCPFCKYDYYRK